MNALSRARLFCVLGGLLVSFGCGNDRASCPAEMTEPDHCNALWRITSPPTIQAFHPCEFGRDYTVDVSADGELPVCRGEFVWFAENNQSLSCRSADTCADLCERTPAPSCGDEDACSSIPLDEAGDRLSYREGEDYELLDIEECTGVVATEG